MSTHIDTKVAEVLRIEDDDDEYILYIFDLEFYRYPTQNEANKAFEYFKQRLIKFLES